MRIIDLQFHVGAMALKLYSLANHHIMSIVEDLILDTGWKIGVEKAFYGKFNLIIINVLNFKSIVIQHSEIQGIFVSLFYFIFLF